MRVQYERNITVLFRQELWQCSYYIRYGQNAISKAAKGAGGRVKVILEPPTKAKVGSIHTASIFLNLRANKG